MNKKTISAKLHWISEEEGRNIPPTAKVYAANLRFLDDNQLWSVVIIPKKYN